MVRSRVFTIIAIVFAGLLCFSAYAVMLFYKDEKLFAEKCASAYLGTPVTFGAMKSSFSDPVTITLDDVHIANQPWGIRDAARSSSDPTSQRL